MKKSTARAVNGKKQKFSISVKFTTVTHGQDISEKAVRRLIENLLNKRTPSKLSGEFIVGDVIDMTDSLAYQDSYRAARIAHDAEVGD